MEYDDSDFGSQNQQLSSEEITKLSPVVSTYSLPNFDFDDSLQGDIRFVSLVETGMFRGIESQEDTSWINDFSRGSGRIDLTSRASDSASISRPNNVWSEATSLESVEVLLKSVAQEDIICGETESHNSDAIELGSSCMQLTQNKEDKENLNAIDVISCATLPLDELLHKFPNEDAPKLHHMENVKSVTDQLSVPAYNNIDMKRQETDAETVLCPVAKDTQEMGIADSPSVDEEHDQVEADTLPERALDKEIQAPVLKAESQANHQQTLISLTENLSSGLHQVNDTCNELNKNLQVNTVEDLSEGIVEPNVEGIDHTAMVNDMQADDSEPEGETAEGVNGDLQSMVPLELDMNSGGQSGPTGKDTDHLKEQFGSSTMGHHDYHSMELCLRQVDASSHAENCKYGSDNHVDADAGKGSNVALESGLAFVEDSAEAKATSLNSGNCHDRKKLSDGPVTGNELYVSPKQNEMLEEFLARGSEICGTDVEEDGLGGCNEQMERASALKKPTENDKILRIASGEMNGQVVNDDFSSGVVCSSTVLETATRASEDSSVCITPTVYEEHITKGVNISSFTTIDLETLETTAEVDLSDVNDKCKDAIMNMQSNSKLSNAGDENCSTGGLLNEDIVVDPPLCSVSNTQNEGTPSKSPSAIPAASGRDSEEPKVIRSSVSCCSEICKDDTETEDSIQGQLDRSVIACIDTGSLVYDRPNPQDPKANDASDHDKTFSFIVASSAEHSERESDKLRQPFASQLPTDSQNVDDSSSTPGMEQISLVNLGNHQTTAEDNLPSCKSTPVRKPRRVPGKTNRENVKRESRQKLAASSKLQESNILSIVVSGLPDLNHASSPPTARPQHFTDLQQLQLRAQIFVYGSLIQGTAPDEACMVAAFGGPGGGRSIWETARRQCLERIQGQKSKKSARAADQDDKTTKYQNKSNNTSTPRTSSKSTPIHTTISHLIPPASPLWTLDTPNRMHYSGMPIGTVLGHNGNSQFNSHLSSPMTGTASSWSPQPVPWVSWPQSSALKASPPPMMDAKMGPVKLTTVRESSMSESSGRHSNPIPVAHPSVNTNINLEVQSPPIENTTLNSNPSQTPFDPKPRKRKKTEVIKDSMLMVAEPLHQVELVSAAYGSSILPTSAVADLSSESKVKTNASSFTIPSASAPSTDHATKGNTNVGNRTVVSEDMCSKMNEAKLYAEDAASHAVAAVDCSQEMWSQLAKQKDSGLLPDIEAKVASAAVAIVAAVAVAKAAAAAAKVAYNAAIHAKLTAEEAMNSSRIIDSPTEVSFNSSANNLGSAMLSSALKGGDQMNSSGILGGMLNSGEKVKSVSAASKQAENINAVLKAAELAAEAVTQAGKVVVMGDPLPLSDLVTAGPEGCWKLLKLTSERELQSDSVIECHVVEANTEVANTSKSILETNHMPKQTTDDHSMDLIFDDGCKPASMDLSNKVKKAVGTAEAIPIKEGSFVEVYKEGDAIKAAWFPACVLEMKNGEAYVCYTENPPTGSSGEIKEWIRLDIHENKAPKIRAAHPMTAMPADGTRKRRREAMGKCYWSVGDKVDAWRQNCWWEGIITEKCSKDGTAFMVHFSAQGEPAIIKACHLRPSLIRKNGEWVQCSNSSYDGCIRQEKRMKLYDPKHEVKLNEKAPDNVDTTQPRMHGESRLLISSDNKKTFDVGKSSKNDKRPVTRRTAQAGLQTKGKKVIFGVPRLGKNTKLMDASEQHVSGDRTMNKSDDSMRHPKTLLSQGSGLPVWKTSSRIDMREKKVPATQLRVPDSRKPTGVSHRTLEKNSVSSCNVNAFRSQGMTGFASFSSIGRVQNSPFGFSMSSNEDPKKMFTSTSSKPELASKSKFEPPPLKKLAKIEEDKVHNGSASTSVSEGGQSRRSNRRIQPRLLEGLQTSLGIQKLPSASHGKGLKMPQQ